MEQFYNLICQWYVPNKHAGMLPEQAENMLNYDASQVIIWYEPSVLGSAYMYSWRGSWSTEEMTSTMIDIIHVILQNVCVSFRVLEDMMNMPDRPPRWNFSYRRGNREAIGNAIYQENGSSKLKWLEKLTTKGPQ